MNINDLKTARVELNRLLTEEPRFFKCIWKRRVETAKCRLLDVQNKMTNNVITEWVKQYDSSQRLPFAEDFTRQGQALGYAPETIENRLRSELERIYPMPQGFIPFDVVRDVDCKTLRRIESAYQYGKSKELQAALAQWRKSNGPASDFTLLEQISTKENEFVTFTPKIIVWHRMPIKMQEEIFKEDYLRYRMTKNVLNLKEGALFSLAHPLSTSPRANWWAAGRPEDLSEAHPDKGTGIIWEMLVSKGAVWLESAYLKSGIIEADSVEIIVPAFTSWKCHGWRDLSYRKSMVGARRASSSKNVRFKTLLVEQIPFDSSIPFIDNDPYPYEHFL